MAPAVASPRACPSARPRLWQRIGRNPRRLRRPSYRKSGGMGGSVRRDKAANVVRKWKLEAGGEVRQNMGKWKLSLAMSCGERASRLPCSFATRPCKQRNIICEHSRREQRALTHLSLDRYELLLPDGLCHTTYRITFFRSEMQRYMRQEITRGGPTFLY